MQKHGGQVFFHFKYSIHVLLRLNHEDYFKKAMRTQCAAHNDSYEILGMKLQRR